MLQWPSSDLCTEKPNVRCYQYTFAEQNGFFPLSPPPSCLVATVHLLRREIGYGHLQWDIWSTTWFILLKVRFLQITDLLLPPRQTASFWNHRRKFSFYLVLFPRKTGVLSAANIDSFNCSCIYSISLTDLIFTFSVLQGEILYPIG